MSAGHTPLRRRSARRIAPYGAVGLSVMAFGYLALTLFVEVLGWPRQVAYLAQALLSIELNFALNRAITWRDRRAAVWRPAVREWGRFHLTRTLTLPLNQVSFAALTGAGLGYLAANTVCLGLAAGVSFVVAEWWVFDAQEPRPA